MFYGHAVFIGLSLSSQSNSENLARYKKAADILMGFPGEFFTEEIEGVYRVAITLFDLKSVLYPADTTAYLDSFWLLLPMNIV